MRVAFIEYTRCGANASSEARAKYVCLSTSKAESEGTGATMAPPLDDCSGARCVTAPVSASIVENHVSRGGCGCVTARSRRCSGSKCIESTECWPSNGTTRLVPVRRLSTTRSVTSSGAGCGSPVSRRATLKYVCEGASKAEIPSDDSGPSWGTSISGAATPFSVLMARSWGKPELLEIPRPYSAAPVSAGPHGFTDAAAVAAAAVFDGAVPTEAQITDQARRWRMSGRGAVAGGGCPRGGGINIELCYSRYNPPIPWYE
jgi:hypothetical protein